MSSSEGSSPPSTTDEEVFLFSAYSIGFLFLTVTHFISGEIDKVIRNKKVGGDLRNFVLEHMVKIMNEALKETNKATGSQFEIQNIIDDICDHQIPNIDVVDATINAMKEKSPNIVITLPFRNGFEYFLEEIQDKLGPIILVNLPKEYRYR